MRMYASRHHILDGSSFMTLDIAAVFAQLPKFLSHSESVWIDYERDARPPRGNIHIDGRRCASTISLWANGQCDIALLSFVTEQQNIDHYEFVTEAAAVEAITLALKAALEYA
jgi:hypothetical protein